MLHEVPLDIVDKYWCLKSSFMQIYYVLEYSHCQAVSSSLPLRHRSPPPA